MRWLLLLLKVMKINYQKFLFPFLPSHSLSIRKRCRCSPSQNLDQLIWKYGRLAIGQELSAQDRLSIWIPVFVQSEVICCSHLLVLDCLFAGPECCNQQSQKELWCTNVSWAVHGTVTAGDLSLWLKLFCYNVNPIQVSKFSFWSLEISHSFE